MIEVNDEEAAQSSASRSASVLDRLHCVVWRHREKAQSAHCRRVPEPRCPRRKEGASRVGEFFNNFNKWYKLCICRGLLRLRLAARCVRLRHETVSLASAHAYLCISLPPPCVCKSLRLAPHVEGKRVNASAARAYMRTAAVSLFGCRIGVSSVHTTSGIASLCVPDGIN